MPAVLLAGPIAVMPHQFVVTTIKLQYLPVFTAPTHLGMARLSWPK